MNLRISIALLLLVGCTSGPATAPSSRQADAPSAAPLAGEFQRIDDVLPTDRTLNLTFRVATSHHALLFGQFDRINGDAEVVATTPVIVQTDKFRKPAIAMPIEDDRLKDAAWVFVGSGPAKDEIWGVLDASLDDRQADLLIIHCSDTGNNWKWTVQTIHKPDDRAGFDSFALDRDGRGRMTLYLAADAKHHRAGRFYHYRTTDGGKTWPETPDYEPDALKPADDVSDEDFDTQPPKLQKAARTDDHARQST